MNNMAVGQWWSGDGGSMNQTQQQLKIDLQIDQLDISLMWISIDLF